MGCPKCFGTGYRYSACPECHGSDAVWCNSCAGAGKVIETCRCANQFGMNSNQPNSDNEQYGDYRAQRPGMMS
ncbi:MAG TPA: hypothetical protein VFC63_18330 [Blastocatellia bacterium]|nr:hypothetical protein [Blastocatellia bacterium]